MIPLCVSMLEQFVCVVFYFQRQVGHQYRFWKRLPLMLFQKKGELTSVSGGKVSRSQRTVVGWGESVLV